MRRYHLQSVFLSRGWARDAVVTVSDAGFITAIDSAAAEFLAGYVFLGRVAAQRRGFSGASETLQ